MINNKIGENPKFQVLSHAFSVSPSTENYYLSYSADGFNWTEYGVDGESVEIPSGETLVVTDCAYGQYIFLDGYIPQDENGDPAEFGTLIY